MFISLLILCFDLFVTCYCQNYASTGQQSTLLHEQRQFGNVESVANRDLVRVNPYQSSSVHVVNRYIRTNPLLSPTGTLQDQRFINSSTAPVIRTTLGLIKGNVYLTNTDYPMFAYLSVPYSETPLKFGKPIAKKPWSNIYDATQYGYGCSTVTQLRVQPGDFATRGDDCHFLKILVPSERSGPLPVLFWMPGGGFNAGANRDYNLDAQGNNIVAKGVILVQPNYRLGPLGFWSSESDDAPGNLALWDSLEALKFVKREIAAFGGDADRILMMGQGAGAISASALTLSPLANGLYQRSALLSGNMWSPKVNVRSDVLTQRNKLFATFAGCDDHENTLWNSGRRSNIVQCLRQQTTNDLLLAAANAGLSGPHDWAPRLSDGVHGILPLPLERLARQRLPLPVLQGTSEHETSWDTMVSRTLFESNAGLLIPENLNILNSPSAVIDQCKQQVTEDYYRDPQLVQALCITRYVDYHSALLNSSYHQNNFGLLQKQNIGSVDSVSLNDPLFWWKQAVKVGSVFAYQAPSMLDMAYQMSQGNCNAFLYSLDYVRSQAGDWWKTAGAFHNMDILFLEDFLRDSYGDFKFDHQDLIIQKALIDMITNFAKTGDPTPDNQQLFKPMSLPSDFSYYSIAYPTSQMKPCYHQEDILFWKQAVPLTIRERENEAVSLLRHQCDQYITNHDTTLCKPVRLSRSQPGFIPATEYLTPLKVQKHSGYEHINKQKESTSTGYEHVHQRVPSSPSGYEHLLKTNSATGVSRIEKLKIPGVFTGYEHVTRTRDQQSLPKVEQISSRFTGHDHLTQQDRRTDTYSGYEHKIERSLPSDPYRFGEHRLLSQDISTTNYSNGPPSGPTFFNDTISYTDPNTRHVYKIGLNFGSLIKNRFEPRIESFDYTQQKSTGTRHPYGPVKK